MFEQPKDSRRQVMRQDSCVEVVHLDRGANSVLAMCSHRISSVAGGCDTPGVADLVQEASTEFLAQLTDPQLKLIESYRDASLAALLIDGARDPLEYRPVPERLPTRHELAADPVVSELAIRSQILLAALGERAVAFDAENEGRICRLVANFQGGGAIRLAAEANDAGSIKSSHHGGLLGAHTEGPYYATQGQHGHHAPAPSSLILTALYNPLAEPTTVLPTKNIINALAGLDVLSLAQPHFAFAASESYTAGTEPPDGVPVLEMTRQGVFALRFNVHRIKPATGAPAAASKAIEALKAAVARARPHRVALSPTRLLVINNTRALHGRDTIRDNRRVLIRLFGYRADVSGEIVSTDPLVVRA